MILLISLSAIKRIQILLISKKRNSSELSWMNLCHQDLLELVWICCTYLLQNYELGTYEELFALTVLNLKVSQLSNVKRIASTMAGATKPTVGVERNCVGHSTHFSFQNYCSKKFYTYLFQKRLGKRPPSSRFHTIYTRFEYYLFTVFRRLSNSNHVRVSLSFPILGLKCKN